MKKTFKILGTSLLALSLTSAVFAATTSTTTPANIQNPPAQNLTDEQKAEMDQKIQEEAAQREAQIAKWNALTDAQKESIYAIQDEIDELQQSIIDKYVTLGLMDSTTASELKSEIIKKTETMRTNGEMPSVFVTQEANKEMQGEKPDSMPEKAPVLSATN